MKETSAFSQLPAEDQKRLLDKLAKLKALSECATGNVNETATAAATMTRIMLEYEIQMVDLCAADEPEDLEVVQEPVFEEDSYNGYPVWKTTLLCVIAEVHHCSCFRQSKTEYDFWSRETRTRLWLIGTPRDIANARRLFLFCVDEIERLCQLWGVGQSVKRRNDFKRGASSGVHDKVKAEREKVVREEFERARAEDHASLALELFDRKERAVQRYAAQLNLGTHVPRVRSAQADAYQSGYQAGANLELSRGARPALPAARGR